MASGQPFSENEKQFIRDNSGKMSNGMIAQELGKRFPQDNNGYRSWRSVRSFVYREAGKSLTLTIRVRAETVQKARTAGLTMEEILQVAREAVEHQLKQAGKF